ncbi:MAG: hypothetical protein CMP16_00975 [Rickettsiales bacterium]|nr:hypothetical protein [Rickettsiales bacterium]|tara:strand:+ start:2774 stop:3982 length:1209 start_codon:yes stop_codon:yes gene_type:complete
MVDIFPFKGTRPFNEDAKSLIAPSTDHLSIENIEIFKKNNYWNYLKILNPVGQLKEKDSLLEAKLHFDEMKKNEVIKKDVTNYFYVYQIQFYEHVQLGFLSLGLINDFINKKIKAHEKIYESRMKERAEQMNNIEAQIGPIYVSYPSNEVIDNLLKSYTNIKPDYDFESFDKSIHKLWCVKDLKFHNLLIQNLKNIKNFYIADGHHRMGAMTLISDLYKSKNKLFKHVMLASFPTTQSKIFDYNRVIKDLNGLSENKFIKLLSKNFTIKFENKPFKPIKKYQFGMYHENKWYSLDFKHKIQNDNILENLDINILNNYCLKPHLNIHDVNNDERIRFIAGCHGLEALEKKVNENKDSVAFSIFPSTISDVIKIADNDFTMPPKTTWFDPKPLDGLVVYEFNQE